MKYEKREEARFIFGMQSAFNKGQMKLKRFPQAKFGHPLTEKIHSDRIAASEGTRMLNGEKHDYCRDKRLDFLNTAIHAVIRN